MFLAGVIRWTSGRIAAEHVVTLAFRWALPAAVIAVAVATGFAAAFDGARSTMIADLTGRTSATALAVLATYAALLALRGRRPPATVCVNPWL